MSFTRSPCKHLIVHFLRNPADHSLGCEHERPALMLTHTLWEHTITFLRLHVRVGPDEQPLLYGRPPNTSNIGTGPPLVTTVGITPFHFSTARP